MTHFATIWRNATLLLLAVFAGCASSASRGRPVSMDTQADAMRPCEAGVVTAMPSYQTPPPVAQVSYQTPNAAEQPDWTATPVAPTNLTDPLDAGAELSVEQLVAEVQARNPSLQAASAAWRAAAERYPQAVSLDDPMFAAMIGPRGVGADNGGGWMVEYSQKIPWAGKRALRGSAASADADALHGDIGDVRLRLSEAAQIAFQDYYLAKRRMEINDSNRRLMKEFREIAWKKYQLGQATQQDALQADVESAALESRRLELERDEKIAVARINTLLHRAPDRPLPPPPSEMPIPAAPPSAEALRQTAVESRPDLYAARARVCAEEANYALACKDYYPDVNLVAKYDGFMPEEMRPQVGMEVNVPLGRARRAAAVREAAERLAQRRAEYQERLDRMRFEVQSAFDRATQARQIIGLYREKILPAALRSAESAAANYTNGKLDFLRLLDAQRQVYLQREMHHQAIAEYGVRLAELNRAVGEPTHGER